MFCKEITTIKNICQKSVKYIDPFCRVYTTGTWRYNFTQSTFVFLLCGDADILVSILSNCTEHRERPHLWCVCSLGVTKISYPAGTHIRHMSLMCNVSLNIFCRPTGGHTPLDVLLLFILYAVRQYWMKNPFLAELSYLNFHQPKVLSRYRDPQHLVA